MLTLEEFKAFPNRKVFARGEITNSPEGIYMTSSNLGDKLRWVAKKGYANDFAIYCHWAFHEYDWIKEHGDKVTSKENILKCLPCDKEVMNLYRY